MDTIILKTKRAILREMKQTDKTDLMTIFTDPVAMKYYPSIKNEEETFRWIHWCQNNYRKFHVGMWVVEQKRSGEFLGQCGLVPQKIDGIVQMELGYLFVRDVWGKGFATETAKACIEYGFNHLELEQISSIIHPQNNRSIKVAEKLGMTVKKIVAKWGMEMLLYQLRN